MHENGEDAVVARMTLQYKVPLRSEDTFRSCLRIKKEGVKYIFFQDIYRLSDEKLSFRAQVEVVCLVNGKLSDSETCNKAFAEYLK